MRSQHPESMHDLPLGNRDRPALPVGAVLGSLDTVIQQHRNHAVGVVLLLLGEEIARACTQQRREQHAEAAQ